MKETNKTKKSNFISIGNVYYLVKKVEIKDKNVTINKNYPVVILEVMENTCLVKSEEKNVTFETTKTNLKEGPETLGENETFMAYFRSDYRGYYAFSTDITIAANNVLKQYNKYCDETFSFERIATEEDYFMFVIYKVDMSNLTFDDEYMDIDTKKENKNSHWYVGDYLNKFRKNPKKIQYENKFPFERWVVDYK